MDRQGKLMALGREDLGVGPKRQGADVNIADTLN